MGELLDQILAGGPELSPLDAAQAAFAADLAARPERYAQELRRPEIMDPLRAAVAQGAISSGRDATTLPLEDLIRACALADRSEAWARQLLSWLGHGGIGVGLRDWSPLFRDVIRERACWERQHARGDWWVGGPIQRLAAMDSVTLDGGAV